VARLALLDPTKCFVGQRAAYLLHATPFVLSPSPKRFRAVLEWEAGGRGQLDADWLRLVTGAVGEFPTAKVVLPRRPTADRLRDLTLPTLVLLAERSRQHDIARLASNARRLVHHAVTTVLPDVSHHSTPIRHAERLNSELLEFVG
jgi:pimeloyl-ACP methyl ester carboxylesterase